MNATELKTIADNFHAQAELAKQTAAVTYWKEVAQPHMVKEAKAGKYSTTFQRSADITDYYFFDRLCRLAEAEGYTAKSNYYTLTVEW